MTNNILTDFLALPTKELLVIIVYNIIKLSFISFFLEKIFYIKIRSILKNESNPFYRYSIINVRKNKDLLLVNHKYNYYAIFIFHYIHNIVNLSSVLIVFIYVVIKYFK